MNIPCSTEVLGSVLHLVVEREKPFMRSVGQRLLDGAVKIVRCFVASLLENVDSMPAL